MTPKELVESFEILAEAPGGAARLRELVLRMAIQGRLSPQDGDDEPASALLDQIAAEKKRLMKDGRIRMPKPLAREREECVVSNLPTGWAPAFLADCFAYDLTDGDWVESKDQDPEGSIRLTQLADVGSGVFKDVSSRFLNEETAERLRCTFLQAGDVLIARLPNPLGRACVFPGLDQTCVTVVDVAIGRSGEAALNRRFLVYLLNSPQVLDRVEQVAAGTTRKRVSTGNLKKIVLPIPPLAEQKRIVKRVDDLMALLDRLEAAQHSRESTRKSLRDAALTALRDADSLEQVRTTWTVASTQMTELLACSGDVMSLREAILNLAVRGYLVPQCPEAEPVASELFVEVARERERRWLEAAMALKRNEGKTEAEVRKLYARPGIGPSTVVSDNLPSGWSLASVEQLTDPVRTVSYGILKPGPDVRGGIPFVKVKDIVDGKVVTGRLRRTTNKIHDQYRRSELAPGDVLVSIRGTVGKVAVVPESLKGGNITQDTARLAFLPPLSIDYMVLALRAPQTQQHFLLHRKGAAVQGLNIRDLRPTPVPVPPLGEQARIVARVAELLRMCDHLERNAESASVAQSSFARSVVSGFAL